MKIFLCIIKPIKRILILSNFYRISKESIVDVQATVKESPITIESCTQNKVELLIKQLWVTSESEPQLPLQIEDANRKDIDEEDKEGLAIRVNQDTRLDNRVLDLRTPTNQVLLNDVFMTLDINYITVLYEYPFHIQAHRNYKFMLICYQ